MNDHPHIVFALAGVGLGNATRCGAVMAALSDLRCEAISFGVGARFLRARGVTVHELRGLFLPTTAAATLLAVPLLFLLWLANGVRSLAILRRLRPQLLVVDSEYATLIPARLLGIPVVGINQAAAVRAMWRRYARRDLALSYYTREVPDACFCRLLDTTYVPTFLASERLPPRHLAIPLIVRDLPPRAPAAGYVVAMHGGSTHTADIRMPSHVKATAIGGPRVVDDALDHLARAERAVVQGGLSSVSEVIALGLPAAVVPLPGHAEQVLHARWLADHGIVWLDERGDLTQTWDAFLRFSPAAHNIRTDGATVLARHLRGRVQP